MHSAAGHHLSDAHGHQPRTHDANTSVVRCSHHAERIPRPRIEQCLATVNFLLRPTHPAHRLPRYPWATMPTVDVQSLVNDNRRVIPLFAVHNFRDLGGYPTADGRHTRWRTLFRADGLYRLTPDDARQVIDLGVRTVVDLRTDNELRTRGTFPVDQYPVSFHHLPIIDATWGETAVLETDDAVEFLVWAYRQMLGEAAPRFADAMNLLASHSVLPAVFHCAAGKDRTGILSALVLGTLGVDAEVIAADYGLTEQSMQRLVVWAREHQPELAELYEKMPARFAAADPAAMRVILADIEASHGSVEGYVRAIGVTEASIASLRNTLLHDA
ncbi:MAG: tyrosine-protein phosphatase [Actinobacteria bacterium]|nr:tyrosine-protein phosphatase [Actinomycetota bacterium]